MTKRIRYSRAENPDKSVLDKHVVITVQQLVTYAAILVTIGASIYTFFKAIPKIDKLDETVVQLQISNTRVEERIASLKEFLATRKVVSDTTK